MAEVDSSGNVRPPPLTQSDAITSLLSLSISAAGASSPSSAAVPMPIPTTSTSMLSTSGPHVSTLSASLNAATSPAAAAGKHHRRLGSTGKTRRRLSDAREATSRPLLAAAATNSSAALSLASLSLSTSPPSSHGHSHSLGSIPHVIGHGHSHSYSHGYSPLAPKPTTVPVPAGIPIAIVSGSTPRPISVSGFSVKEGVDGDAASIKGDTSENGTNEREESASSTTPIPISGGKAKKRGIDYKCESCSKIYRHPNCLNKHRWEHTKQWREASKFVLSKHQQVQLLEAAAILSYMGKCPTSLPEDRSEWPSFLSGGSLPKTEPVSGSAASSTITAAGGVNGSAAAPGMPAYGSIGHAQHGYSTRTYALHPHPISASVPTGTTSGFGSGPRMHDYTIPVAAASGGSVSGSGQGVTQVAPGLVGVPTAPPSSGGHAIIGDRSGEGLGFGLGSGGWSLPSSSVRSGPASLSYSASATSRSASRSRSRSGSGSRSDESVDIDVVGMDEGEDTGLANKAGTDINVVNPGAQSLGMGMGYSLGYGYTGYGGSLAQSYGRRSGAMKREEDEMSVGFSVREEDEDAEEEEEEEVVQKRGEQRQWDGMEMDLDMDMD